MQIRKILTCAAVLTALLLIPAVSHQILQQFVHHLGGPEFFVEDRLEYVAGFHREIVGVFAIPLESHDMSQ